jgi:hypothetical protein
MFTILNFLSFESINFFKLLHELQKGCGTFNPFCFNNLLYSQSIAGYTSSHCYKEISEFFPGALFILIKENPETVLNHLLYAYYKGIYDDKIIEDFKKYYQVDLKNIDSIDIAGLMNNYYTDIENTFDDNLIVVDLTSYDNSFISFLTSPEFKFFVEQLDAFPLGRVVEEAAERIQENVKIGENLVFTDFFIKSRYHGVPTDYLFTGHCLDLKDLEETYLDYFLKDLKANEI